MPSAPNPSAAPERSSAGAATAPPRLEARLFINRELSWLEFNQRVLDEAADRSLPVAERLKFLGIVASNLDEFFMVRVAGLKTQIEAGVLEAPPDGMLPREQLAAVSARVHRMVGDQYQLWREELRPALEREHGIRILRPSDLSPEQAEESRRQFRDRIFPLLTPLAHDRSHPFPQLRNKSISLAVQLPRPGAKRRATRGTVAVVGVPTATVPRLVPVSGDRVFVLVEDLVSEHVAELFFSGAKFRTAAFRVTRNWDLDVDLEEGDDLLALVSEGVRRRDLGAAVRLEFASDAPREITDPLARQHGLADDDVYAIDGPLQLQDLAQLAEVIHDRRGRIAASPPAVPAAVVQADTVMEAMRKGDVLLHHPYDSFDPVVRFIEEAADDPHVKAIKQVLYRTGTDSPFVKALLKAAEKRKEVAVFLEIRARLDEENNIGPIEDLKRAGAMVVYGYDACKTHCKVSLVVRVEDGVPRRYVHVGTGNYNPTTARIYTDVSLLTARRDVAEEVEAVFHMLTGNTTAGLAAQGVVPQWPWRRLAIAPHRLKERVLELIGAEAAEAAAGRPARVRAKMNSLVDREVIGALYRASQAGVRIDLLVRGICCLRPGVPGVSERIRVHQVVDRFLEHSRIFLFGEGKRAQTFISSADWMPRNFHSRVEVMAPVDDPTQQARLLEIVESGLADTAKGSALGPDGRYTRLKPAAGDVPVRSQDALGEALRGSGATPRDLHAVITTAL